jgi:hypothetical protein
VTGRHMPSRRFELAALVREAADRSGMPAIEVNRLYEHARDVEQASRLTDAMVERAATALYDTPVYDFNRTESRDVARRVLTAALGGAA